MQIERRRFGHVTIVTLNGTWDAFNLPAIAAKIDAFIDDGASKLVLNLRKLRFINSSAMGYLIKTQHGLGERGGELVLSQPSVFFRTTLEVLGFQRIFHVVADDNAALGYFGILEPESLDTVPDDLPPAAPTDA